MKKSFALLIVILCSIGVFATAISTGINNQETPVLSALSVLKYFTIQSNLIVIIYFGLMQSKKIAQNKLFKKFFGAVIIYITITFLVFVSMLQSIWHPTGIGFLGNLLNHYISFAMVIIFFIIYRKEYLFKMKDILSWIIYPLVYIVFLIFHGLLTNDYLYPFFDINEIGIGYFLIAFTSIMILFAFLSTLLVFISNREKTKIVY